jgi:hypothetical protein
MQCYPKTKTNMSVIGSKDQAAIFSVCSVASISDLKFLVMDIERMNILGRTTALGPRHSGQYRFDHLLAQDQKRRQGADARSAHSVATRFAEPLHQRLASAACASRKPLFALHNSPALVLSAPILAQPGLRH